MSADRVGSAKPINKPTSVMGENSNTFIWDGRTPLDVAVMVDVDGTLAGIYQGDRRALRASAPAALEMLSQVAPVILWSSSGADNGLRLVAEYPELYPFVAHFASKIGFPLDLIDRPYCIDDNDIEDVVLQCKRVIVDSYEGGTDSGQLLEAARLIADDIRSGTD
jgi:hypothetical protein